VITDLKIITGSNGYFLSMPSKKRKDGTYKDIAHPINSETRKMLEDKVILEYEKMIQNLGAVESLSVKPCPHVERSLALRLEVIVVERSVYSLVLLGII
jgi:hypothetical protein